MTASARAAAPSAARVPDLQRHVHRPEVAGGIGHHQQEIDLTVPPASSERADERHRDKQDEQGGEEREPTQRMRGIGLAAERPADEKRGADPGEPVQRGPVPDARDGEDEEVEDHEVDEQVPLVGLLHREEHRCQEAAEHGDHRRRLPVRHDRDERPEESHREHAGKGPAGTQEPVERMGAEEREVEHAQPQPGQRRAEIAQVAAAVQHEAAREQPHARHEAQHDARAGPEEVILE